MKRVLLYLALLSLSTSCISRDTNEDVKSISTLKFLTESAIQLKDYEWLSFNVDMVALKDGKVWYDRKYDVILHYDKKKSSYLRKP